MPTYVVDIDKALDARTTSDSEAARQAEIKTAEAAAQSNYERFGVNPPYYHSDPYATANAFITMYPDGSYGRTDLSGFPSRYPHVVTRDPLLPNQLIGAMLGALPAGRAFDLPSPPKQPGSGNAAKAAEEQKEQPVVEQPQPAPAQTPYTYYAFGEETTANAPRSVETSRYAGDMYNSGVVSHGVHENPNSVGAGAMAAIDAMNNMYNMSLNGVPIDYAAKNRGAQTRGTEAYARRMAEAQGGNTANLRNVTAATHAKAERARDAYRRALNNQTGRGE